MRLKNKLILACICLIISFIVTTSGVLFGVLYFVPTIEKAKDFTETSCYVLDVNVTATNYTGSCSDLDDNVWWVYWLGTGNGLLGGMDELSGGANTNSKNRTTSTTLTPHGLQDQPPQPHIETTCYQGTWSVDFELSRDNIIEGTTQSLWTSDLNLLHNYTAFYKKTSSHVCYYDQKKPSTDICWSKLTPFKRSYLVISIAIGVTGTIGMLLSFFVIVVLKRRQSRFQTQYAPPTQAEHQLFNHGGSTMYNRASLFPGQPQLNKSNMSINTFIYSNSEFKLEYDDCQD
ncbi:hypothetical protein SAMD00019534_055260 [Acytostelium subglobosum LB1]|uniref:hypothetical protein n=1 Tax=Acytostelium subglobosum LB1 TaxID=1410327 RepID=UPI000644B6A3|nr:hypothetical protein SAMD00019534_055260 [Acytostelium subglobosum LB1]GAM22351.1 hypothetical protein SAMD00019534_055260 [Acytostelium subglobosum LB1]|eukprot:XP_012754471.1 hypothetical protein SAMD00019534_055260 [Acytostelium subglobosum LB1]